jgi:hypothetical protein
VPAVLNNDDGPLHEMRTRSRQHIAEALDNEVGTCIAEAKENNADNLPLGRRQDFAKIQVKRQNDALLLVRFLEDFTIRQRLQPFIA